MDPASWHGDKRLPALRSPTLRLYKAISRSPKWKVAGSCRRRRSASRSMGVAIGVDHAAPDSC